MIYLVCYDITDPKRLRKTAKVLLNYGLRLQKSFFQTDIDDIKLKFIRDLILKIIDVNKDYLFIYPLCNKCTKKAIVDGQGEILKLNDFEIL